MTQHQISCSRMTALHGANPVTVRRIFSLRPRYRRCGNGGGLFGGFPFQTPGSRRIRALLLSAAASLITGFIIQRDKEMSRIFMNLFLNKYYSAEPWRIPRPAHTIEREESIMFSYLFTFRSQTAAQSGRRILYEAGLWTQLRRAPQEVSEPRLHVGRCMWRGPTACTPHSSCAHGAARVSGAYRVHPNGFLEEAQL